MTMLQFHRYKKCNELKMNTILVSQTFFVIDNLKWEDRLCTHVLHLEMIMPYGMIEKINVSRY